MKNVYDKKPRDGAVVFSDGPEWWLRWHDGSEKARDMGPYASKAKADDMYEVCRSRSAEELAAVPPEDRY